MGLFLRAYRICSEEFLEEKVEYVIAALWRLGYLKGLILSLRRRAEEIIHVSRLKEREGNATKRTSYMALSNYEKIGEIIGMLRSTEVIVAITSERRSVIY